MEDRYIATVDLGTSKIALAVARVTGSNAEVLYYKENPSDGVRHGGIFNPTKASVPLKKAIDEAENELGIKISQVVIGVPRYGVKQESNSAKVDRTDADSCITQEEIDTIKNMALDSYPLANLDEQEIYGGSAQSFSTDDFFNYKKEDVVGMPSRVLEGNFKVFIGAKKASRNIDIMLNSAGVAPARKFFLPPLCANAVLNEEEKENGVALVEIGAGVSSVTIYHGGILRYYHAIPFGGATVTNDIKLECGFTEHLAENIKLAFGACIPEKLQSMSEKILQIKDEENGTDQQLHVKYLSEIITARMREIIEAILFKIQESGFADRLRSGVVLTGGCADLAGCSTLFKDMSGYSVRTGYPRAKGFSASGCPAINETSAAATVGMLLQVRDDTHLNCVDSLVGKEKEQETAPVQDTPEEESLEGTVFGADAWEVKDEKRKRIRKQKNKEKKDTFQLSWVKKVEDLVGNLYEKIEDK